MNIHPLNGLLPIISFFISLILFFSLFEVFSIISLLLTIVLAGLPIYFSKKRKKHTIETVMREVGETILYRTKGYHPDLKKGHLGVTKNYLFFVPFNVKEQAIIIRGSFLTEYEIAPYDSGNYFVHTTRLSDSLFNVSSKSIKWQAFFCAGVTDDTESFDFGWILPSSIEGKKMMKMIEKMDNVDFKTNEVLPNRKLF